MKHCIALVLSFALTAVSTAADALPHSEEILALSGVDGGLVVVIGCPSSPDLFIADGAVWVQRNCTGFDPLTGEPLKQRGNPRSGPMSHDRCHRNKATQRFIIESTSGGNDFSYLGSERSLSHPWVHNTCSLGGMPCNGLFKVKGLFVRSRLHVRAEFPRVTAIFTT